MKTGYRGAFVISWSQTELDGLEGAPMANMSIGSAWAWRGQAVRVDGPQTLLSLDQSMGAETLRRRAARVVTRLVGAALDERKSWEPEAEDMPLFDAHFVVTDGVRGYTVTLIATGQAGPPLLMFVNDIPPRKTDLWVVRHQLNLIEPSAQQEDPGGVICFTPGTRIDTPGGQRLIDDLTVGDRISTRDNGPQEVLWIGRRRMSGARLYAMPHLRPVRVSAGAFNPDQPQPDLLVSPQHRLLIEGKAARDLFNEHEVLATAFDMVDGNRICVDMALREVTYIHLLLPSHQIITANGLPTESFHPASAAFGSLDPDDHTRLLALCPGLDEDPFRYGAFARRNISASEAAILRHVA